MEDVIARSRREVVMDSKDKPVVREVVMEDVIARINVKLHQASAVLLIP